MSRSLNLYTSIPQEWIPKVESTREKLEKQRQEARSRETTSILRSALEYRKEPNKYNAFKRRYRRTQKAGIFAHMKCSNNHNDFDKVEEDFETFDNSPQLKKMRREDPVKKVILPNLRKQESDVETESSKIEKITEQFSHRLNFTKFNPELTICSKFMLGEVEIGILKRVLSDPDDKKKKPIFDIIQDKSDVLLYSEEYASTEDYIPKDPHFMSDEITSNFDSYRSTIDQQKSWDFPSETGESVDEQDARNLSQDFFSTFSPKEETDSDFFNKNEIHQNDFNNYEFQKTQRYYHHPQADAFNFFEDSEVPRTSSSSQSAFDKCFRGEKNQNSQSFNFF